MLKRNFSFFESISDSIHRFLKNKVCIKFFNGNYNNSANFFFFCPIVLHKYNLCKYVITFNAKSQVSVNEPNPTCRMSFVLFLL